MQSERSAELWIVVIQIILGKKWAHGNFRRSGQGPLRIKMLTPTDVYRSKCLIPRTPSGDEA